MATNKNPDVSAIFRYAILFLFFIQSAGMLVEAIYILDLMNTRLDEKAAGILFFFSPVLLLFFRRGYPGWLGYPGKLGWAAALTLIVSRGIAPSLDTDGRLLVAGIATGAALVLLAMWLGEARSDADRKGRLPAGGFALALGLSTLLRTLNYSLDLSLEPGGTWIGWGLGLAWLGTLFMRGKTEDAQYEAGASQPIAEHGTGAGAVRGALGIFAILALGYLAFFSPGVIARWTQGSYTLIVGGVSLLALVWVWLFLFRPTLLDKVSPALLAGWNLLFTAALSGLILSHSVPFPAALDSPAVVVGAPSALQGTLLVATLLLFPVIFMDLAVFSAMFQRAQPSPRRAAGGFLLGAFFLVLLVFMHIFSNVWGYVEPVSPLFRGKFWLPYLLPALLAALLAPLAWHKLAGARQTKTEATTAPLSGLLSGALLAGIFLITIGAAWRSERTLPPPAGDASSLKVMTYNIQQANDNEAQRAHLRQLDLIRQVNPDVLALQESDSARISLGNNDYARYYAGKLGYYSYYGPTTVSGTFGTALLSRYPLENTRTIFTFSDQDEIGTTAAEIQVGARRFTIYNVHPDGSDTAMLVFAEELLRQAEGEENLIALGDFNLRPYEAAYQRIDAVLVNAWTAVYPDGGTMPEERRIDHIFVSPGLDVREPVYLLPPESATDHPTHWAEIGW